MGQGLPPLAITEVESSCATCLPSCQPLGGREEQLVNIPAAARVTHVTQLLLRQQQLLRQLPTDTCTTIRQWPTPTAEDRAQVRFFLRFYQSFFCYNLKPEPFDTICSILILLPWSQKFDTDHSCL